MFEEFEFSNKYEEHLYHTMFGGVFGEGWPSLKAPRLYFYFVVLAFALEWLMISFGLIILLGAAYPVVLFSSLLLVWYVYHNLTWQRGQSMNVLDVALMMIDFFIVWPLLEVGLVLEKLICGEA